MFSNCWPSTIFIHSLYVFLLISFLGEAQWSLCVTCGAWMALHLWEHIAYESISSDWSELLVSELLPTLRGVAQFFTEYMYREKINGGSGDSQQQSEMFIAHTGPTTSPENSYTISNGQNGITGLLFCPCLQGNTSLRMVLVFLCMTGDSVTIPAVAPQINKNTNKNNKAPPPPPPEPLKRVNFMTMSPAIDMSILRQVRVCDCDCNQLLTGDCLCLIHFYDIGLHFVMQTDWLICLALLFHCRLRVPIPSQ